MCVCVCLVKLRLLICLCESLSPDTETVVIGTALSYSVEVHRGTFQFPKSQRKEPIILYLEAPIKATHKFCESVHV